MKFKKIKGGLLALLAVGSYTQNACGNDLTVKERPNVLVIAVDDLNHWVGHLKRHPQAKTPNIDRLAKLGMSFSKAYCAVPACNPSRAAALSGQRPTTTACYTNKNTWEKYIKEGVGLSAQFKKAGYHVAGAGKLYHKQRYYKSEWSEYMDSTLYDLNGGKGIQPTHGFLKRSKHDLKDQDLGDWDIVNWCIEQLNSKSEKPLFLACGLYKPHLPFVVPKKYYEMFPQDQIQLPPYKENDLDDIPQAGVRMAKRMGDHGVIMKQGRWKEVVQHYLACVAYTDMNIGRLLDGLAKSPRAKNTIIVLWSDHGWSLGEKNHWRKFALWEEATRIPYIWVAPGVTEPGSKSDQPIDLMTLYPTLCELAGVKVPQHAEGPSAVPLLSGKLKEWEHVALTTHGYMNHAVRKGKYRYIQYANGSNELYDHSNDPYEWTNLATKVEWSAQVKEMQGYLPKENIKPKGK